MFDSYEFDFDGVSSSEYGLMICDIGGRGQSDVSFANTASIIETRTARRIQPIHFGVKYHETPLQFKLVFGSDEPFDRFDFENISLWLTGHQDYKWLSIHQPDLEHVEFRCIVKRLTPISVAWLPYAFEAEIVCDCPYAYGFPFENEYTISGETEILFRNESSVREYFKPNISFLPGANVTSLSIINESDGGREFFIEYLPTARFFADNNNGIIRDANDEYNLYDGFNMNFLRFVQGDNVLRVVGDGILTISGRFLHNVGG